MSFAVCPGEVYTEQYLLKIQYNNRFYVYICCAPIFICVHSIELFFFLRKRVVKKVVVPLDRVLLHSKIMSLLTVPYTFDLFVHL